MIPEFHGYKVTRLVTDNSSVNAKSLKCFVTFVSGVMNHEINQIIHPYDNEWALIIVERLLPHTVIKCMRKNFFAKKFLIKGIDVSKNYCTFEMCDRGSFS